MSSVKLVISLSITFTQCHTIENLAANSEVGNATGVGLGA